MVPVPRLYQILCRPAWLAPTIHGAPLVQRAPIVTHSVRTTVFATARSNYGHPRIVTESDTRLPALRVPVVRAGEVGRGHIVHAGHAWATPQPSRFRWPCALPGCRPSFRTCGRYQDHNSCLEARPQRVDPRVFVARVPLTAR